MRRKDREVARENLTEIMEKCKVFRLGMVDGGQPYIVPLNFGYREKDGGLEIYFHCALEGRKVDILEKNPQVCFEMDCGHRLMTGETGCSYSYEYESIIGTGEAAILADDNEKAFALTAIMKHQTGENFEFTTQQVKNVGVWKITVENISGKARK